MTEIRIRKGLDIPLAGSPEQAIDETVPALSSVAVLGPDTVGLRPRMEVEVGDRVVLGQTLYRDRQNPEVQFTAPGAGRIEAVNRGERRSLQSVVIALDGDEEESYLQTDDLASVSREDVVDNLLASGLWTAFRTRPFSKVPAPDSSPAAIFVTAIDTNPQAADPGVIIGGASGAFDDGLNIIARLADGPVYVCTKAGSGIAVPDGALHAEFDGPHPAGLVGTHIHFLEPVSAKKTVWHLGYQDVIAIGRLFATGRLNPERVIALGGTQVRQPRLLRTRLGANITELVAGQIEPGRKRIISGSVLGGRRTIGPVGWLGRYHTQVSVLPESEEREFLSWARPRTAQVFSPARVSCTSRTPG